MKKTAVVFGAGGQAGMYLCNLLREKDYNVWGMGRSQCDFEDAASITNIYRIFQETQPDEVYNLAGKNHVPGSWEEPESYMQVNGNVVLSILQDLKEFTPKTKFFQAGSAEVFEKGSLFQDECTNRLPNSPYGLSKMLAMEYIRLWREKGLFACTGIFFNMESPWRPKTFFAEKVASEVVQLRRELDAGIQPLPISLGRLDARRDWGLTEEYMEAAWRMLQQDEPADFCIGTGVSNTCLAFVLEAFAAVKIPGEQVDSLLQYDKTQGSQDCLRAITTKAEKRLGWTAQSKMREVVKRLVDAELMRPYETNRTGNELEREVRSS